MKAFYLKHANIKENQLKMAKVGYLSRIRELGSQLVSCTVKESYEIAKELAEVVECFRYLEDEYQYNIKMYQEVALKGVNEAKEEQNG
jgi:hypothetical protein